MGKIGLIIKREYLTRVKKKSFLILTILGPLFWGGLILSIGLINKEADTLKHVYVVDETQIGYYDIFHDIPGVKFHKELHDANLDLVRKVYKDSSNAYVLYINKDVMDDKKVNIFCKHQPNVNITSYISIALSNEIQKTLLAVNHIDKDLVEKCIRPVDVQTRENGSGMSEEEAFGIAGFAMGIIIYMFVLLYSVQVMRGVMEEKSSRIVEVIISSVKPFQLMMGKILGIAMVGLTQFVLWIILSVAVITPLSRAFLTQQHYAEISQPAQSKIGYPVNGKQETKVDFGATKSSAILEVIDRVNWPLILGCFVFYFILGYLLYASLFAAVGSAIDSETDTQQFMLPLSLPLVLSMATGSAIINDPHGPLAFWLSIIPFTSPISMMIRLPSHVPAWQLGLSMTLLVCFFFLMTWLAGKIYRTGILMYGKKTSWKELGKWLFYKG
jgi:ABC-2 type transport system permease protein